MWRSFASFLQLNPWTNNLPTAHKVVVKTFRSISRYHYAETIQEAENTSLPALDI